ncbi:hypothetical protein J6590_045313 [Homalodisca vitripennis]|nr:hypothetical protein J6590_045313 [Homalodisca vitripennis]
MITRMSPNDTKMCFNKNTAPPRGKLQWNVDSSELNNVINTAQGGALQCCTTVCYTVLFVIPVVGRHIGQRCHLVATAGSFSTTLGTLLVGGVLVVDYTLSSKVFLKPTLQSRDIVSTIIGEPFKPIIGGHSDLMKSTPTPQSRDIVSTLIGEPFKPIIGGHSDLMKSTPIPQSRDIVSTHIGEPFKPIIGGHSDLMKSTPTPQSRDIVSTHIGEPFKPIIDGHSDLMKSTVSDLLWGSLICSRPRSHVTLYPPT